MMYVRKERALRWTGVLLAALFDPVVLLLTVPLGPRVMRPDSPYFSCLLLFDVRRPFLLLAVGPLLFPSFVLLLLVRLCLSCSLLLLLRSFTTFSELHRGFARRPEGTGLNGVFSLFAVICETPLRAAVLVGVLPFLLDVPIWSFGDRESHVCITHRRFINAGYSRGHLMLCMHLFCVGQRLNRDDWCSVADATGAADQVMCPLPCVGTLFNAKVSANQPRDYPEKRG